MVQVFTVNVQVLVSGAPQTAQAVQEHLSGYLQLGCKFSASGAWFNPTHARDAVEVQSVAPQPAPEVQYTYSVYYGLTGEQASLLGAGSTLQGAKVAALHAYNDERCGENVTWERMVTELAVTGWYVQIVRTQLP